MKNNFKLSQYIPVPNDVLFIFGASIAMAVNVCILLSNSWANRMDYSFGYLAPIFALFVIYDRRNAIFDYFSASDNAIISPTLATKLVNVFFALMFAGGMAFYLFFTAIYFITQNWSVSGFAMTLGFSTATLAMAYYASTFGQNKTLKERLGFTLLFLFPCLIWIVSAPMFHAIESKVSLFLLSKVAIVVTGVMDMLGYVVELHGNTIQFPNGSVGVADACSGIRSLTGCLFAGSFLAAVFLDKFWKKALLVFISMLCAFFNNLLRALFLSFWAYENGPDSISGFVHDAAGYVILIMTVIELMILLPVFQINPVPPEFRNKAPEFIAENDKAEDEKENED